MVEKTIQTTAEKSWASVRESLRAESADNLLSVTQSWKPIREAALGERRRWIGEGLRVFAQALTVVSCLVASIVWKPEWVSWFAFAICSLLGVSLTILRPHKVDIATESDLALVDNPESEQEMLVSISVLVDGMVRGSDRGVLWTQSGLLYFYGQRSWFRLARHDLKFDPSFLSPTLKGEPNYLGADARLPFCKGDKQLILAIRTLKPRGSTDKNAARVARLTNLVKSFGISEPSPTAVSQFPPMSYQPQVADCKKIVNFFALAVAEWCFVHAALFGAIGITFQILIFVVACGLISDKSGYYALRAKIAHARTRRT